VNKNTFLSILLSFASILFTLILAELFITYKFVKIEFENQTNLSKKYKILNQKVQRQNADNKNYTFYNFVDYKFYLDHNYKKENVVYPLSNISNKKTYFCSKNNSIKFIESDKFGFNNSNSKYLSKFYDIILIGDSFGFGVCVNKSDNIVSKLDALNLNTLNLSSSGNGLIANFATLKEYSKYFNSKTNIILWYEGNDFHNTQDEYNSKILSKYIKDKNFSQNLFKNQETIDRDLTNFYQKIIDKENFIILKYKFEFKKIISLYYSRQLITKNKIFVPSYFNLVDYKNNEYYLDIISYIFLEMKRITSDLNSELIVVYLPDYWRYEKLSDKNLNKLRNKNYKRKKDEIISILEKTNTRYIDIENVFSNLRDPLVFFDDEDDPHYNRLGYDLVANEIYSFLK